MECSICLDCIDVNKNCITTECGHCFHASCLMTNVAHNGFGCPYCRAEMAEVPEDSDDEEDYDEEEEEDEYEDEEYEVDLLDDYSLRGFRWLFQRAEGEEVDDEPDDEFEDDEFEDEESAQPAPARSNNPHVAPWNFVAHHLLQRGVTTEMLVRALLSTSHPEYSDNRECDVSRNAVLGGMQLIIDGFRPYQLETLEREIQQEKEKKEFEIERQVRLRLRALGHNVDVLNSEVDSQIVSQIVSR